MLCNINKRNKQRVIGGLEAEMAQNGTFQPKENVCLQHQFTGSVPITSFNIYQTQITSFNLTETFFTVLNGVSSMMALVNCQNCGMQFISVLEEDFTNRMSTHFEHTFAAYYNTSRLNRNEPLI